MRTSAAPATPRRAEPGIALCSQADIVPRFFKKTNKKKKQRLAGGGSVDARWCLTQPPPQVVLDHGEGQSEESQSRRGGERLNCDLLD